MRTRFLPVGLAGAVLPALVAVGKGTGDALASSVYTIRFAPGVISFPEVDQGRGSRFTATIDDAVTGGDLERVLRNLEVETFVPLAPMFRHLPETNYDRWGNEIELIDMTGDYAVTFEDELSVYLGAVRLGAESASEKVTIVR